MAKILLSEVVNFNFIIQMIKHHHIRPGNGAVGKSAPAGSDRLAAAQLLGCAAYYG